MPGDNVQMKVDLIAPIAMEDGLRFAIREERLVAGVPSAPGSVAKSKRNNDPKTRQRKKERRVRGGPSVKVVSARVLW